MSSMIVLPRGAKLAADAVFRVPGKGSQREVIVRFLLEHKSQIDLDILIRQLAAYQQNVEFNIYLSFEIHSAPIASESRL